MKHIVILGSTGSIGKNTLSVVETHADEFKVVGLAANRDVDTLEQQIRRYRPALVALNEPTAAAQLRERIRDLNCTQVLAGTEGLQTVATMPQASQVLVEWAEVRDCYQLWRRLMPVRTSLLLIKRSW